MKNIAPKRGAVVITGTSSGIGEACALYLDSQGFRVFAGVRKEADGVRLRQRASRRLLTPLLIDITDRDSIASATRTVANAIGDAGLTGLVNNAGSVIGCPLEFMPIEQLRQQFEVNTFGHIGVTQALLPLLRKGNGRIINISSAGGRLATPFIGAYTASKFAIEALTDSLRLELQPWGIHVVLIEPGAIATSVFESAKRPSYDILDALPAEYRDLYGGAVDNFMAWSERTIKAGKPPQVVAHAVERALTAARPKTRYLVGSDAKIQVVIARMPDRLKDWMLARLLGIPKPRAFLDGSARRVEGRRQTGSPPAP
jgi:NAD(P)-dependent dehydrogenase (short-subunit alcohol dehydrogenase family)